MNRDKVRGMIIGGSVGDAWGMPVETWSPEKIREKYPAGITNFIPPKDHKWFDATKTPAGSTTDDTQLTVATMRGLISGFKKGGTISSYMSCIVHEHCMAARSTTDGWGHTTREAVRRLTNGVNWSSSGKTDEPNRGTGNGVPMKCSPLGAWIASPVGKETVLKDKLAFNQWCVDYSAMTHYTKMSAMATLCHVHAIEFCFNWFDGVGMFDQMLNIWDVKDYDISYLIDTNDDIKKLIKLLSDLHPKIPQMSQSEIIQNFGNGSCYVYDSLPFSYAWFIKTFWFRHLNEVVEAGGDTDTNAKIVGEMIGAVQGYDHIKNSTPWAIDGLVGHNHLLDLADEFCETFGVEE
jgi:ADP-ribosylglycohydrolase